MLQVELAGLGTSGTGDAGEGAVQDGTPFVAWTSVLIVVLFTEEGTQGRLKTWQRERKKTVNSVLESLVEIGGRDFHQAGECVGLRWAGIKPQQ